MRANLTSLMMAAACLAAQVATASAEHMLSPGEAIFVRECAKCHQVGANARNRVGPVLNGILGRQAGTVPGFKNYSDALRQSGIVWTVENMRVFIQDPKGMVIGTTQVYKGLKNDESVTQLIEFLKTK